jgi:hypothetical protein
MSNSAQRDNPVFGEKIWFFAALFIIVRRMTDRSFKLKFGFFALVLTLILSAAPVSAEDERLVEDFRNAVKTQSRHNYESYPYAVGVGDDSYTITHSEHKPQKNAARWGKPSNYKYTYNPVKPEKDTITPQRTWGE